jgi:hypothetical protein
LRSTPPAVRVQGGLLADDLGIEAEALLRQSGHLLAQAAQMGKIQFEVRHWNSNRLIRVSSA